MLFRSIETRQQVALGRYTELKLPGRYGEAVLPTIEAIDLIAEPPERGRWIAPRLVRAIDEFIENAMHHATRGSNIALHLSRAETFVRLSVNNAGKVLTQGQSERAFIAFGKAAAAASDSGRIGKNGLGMGLALAKRIVELHGGHVSVHAETEFGSNFVIEMPTGAPGKEDVQLNLEQAKRYAADMSRLLKRRAAKQAPAAVKTVPNAGPPASP